MRTGIASDGGVSGSSSATHAFNNSGTASSKIASFLCIFILGDRACVGCVGCVTRGVWLYFAKRGNGLHKVSVIFGPVPQL